jgi:hypothetical protein
MRMRNMVLYSQVKVNFFFAVVSFSYSVFLSPESQIYTEEEREVVIMAVLVAWRGLGMEPVATTAKQFVLPY